ncbi:MAG: 1-(5-phosphoribosyl)-5-[(5-phosphoribosylamino)methylideneamino]imidazole-4-carboxamide isomerase [Anaerolineae bacterium]
MIVYPAIDLRGGRCVRLRQGDVSAEIVFADDPVEAAQRWVAEGAQWLHVVNLDGALGLSGAANLAALRRILDTVSVPVQFGGGLRTLADVDDLLGLGVARVILGTVALREPEVVCACLARHGAEKVLVGIDARAGRVAVAGWVETSDVEATELGARMQQAGVRTVVYTDVGRDGMLCGVNVEATADLARRTGLEVIASGGVASLEDLRALRARADEGICGVIVGMALYRGAISLSDALSVAKGD